MSPYLPAHWNVGRNPTFLHPAALSVQSPACLDDEGHIDLMRNYLVHVSPARIVDVYEALRGRARAEMYDFKFICVRADYDLVSLREIISAVKPDMPFLAVELDSFMASGDQKLDRAIAVWDSHGSSFGES